MTEKGIKSDETDANGNIQIWLQFLDKQLTPEGVGFLKLCLYSRIKFVHLEKLTTPSAIFSHLLTDLDEQKALQIFLHALRKLGNELRGGYVADRALAYGVTCLIDKEDLLTIQEKFHLCLVKIGIKSRGLKLEVKLEKHFCRPQFLNMNYQNLKHLPDLFIRLIHQKFICWDDTKHLELAFNKYGARICLRYLNQYYLNVGLPTLRLESDHYEEPSSQDCLTSAVETHSGEPSEGEKARLMQRRTPCRPRELKAVGSHGHCSTAPTAPPVKMSINAISGPHNSLFFSEITGVAGGISEAKKQSKETDESTCTEGSDEEYGQDDLQTKLLPRQQSTTLLTNPNCQVLSSRLHNYTASKICCGMFLCGLLLCLIVGSMFGTVWRHLIRSKPAPIQGKEGSVVVLSEINQFFIQSADIYEYLVTEAHSVEIFQYDGSCVDIPSNQSPQQINHFMNITNMYLLEGTIISYTLALPTDHSNEYASVYLTRGLQIFDFNPHELDEEDIVCHDKAFFNDKRYHCSHKVTKSKYYNLNFLLSTSSFDSEYTLNVKFDNGTILTSNLDLKCTVANELHCNVDFLFSATSSCLVGNIVVKDVPDPYLTIDIGVARFWIAPVLVTTIIPVLLLFVLLGCAILSICALLKRTNHGQLQAVHV